VLVASENAMRIRALASASGVCSDVPESISCAGNAAAGRLQGRLERM